LTTRAERLRRLPDPSRQALESVYNTWNSQAARGSGRTRWYLSSARAGWERSTGRFEREARAISALQHPNICTLFDVGSADGTEYLVMELLEGDSLAARLAKGPLPLAQVLRDGAAIADALAKAHRAGIVHRDLKPGNIMLTRERSRPALSFAR
jgi:serine/threonine protein kinase